MNGDGGLPDGGGWFAAARILERLELMRREIPGVRAARGAEPDPEPLHRMRVASRRLRSALGLLGGWVGGGEVRTARGRVRQVTRGLGKARDLDVRIAFVADFLAACPPRERRGADRLLLRLNQARERAQDRVEEILDGIERRKALDPLAGALRRALAERRRWEAEELRGAAAPLLAEAVASLSSWVPYLDSPDRIGEHHELRIAAKRLRYALELFREPFGEALSPFVEGAKFLQSELGAVHDADVWLEELPRFLREERERAERFYGVPRGLDSLRPGVRAIERDRRAFRENRFSSLVGEFRARGGSAFFDPLLELLGMREGRGR